MLIMSPAALGLRELDVKRLGLPPENPLGYHAVEAFISCRSGIRVSSEAVQVLGAPASNDRH